MINGAVSHELRNPLNSLVGQANSFKELLKDFENIINNLTNAPFY